MTGIQLCTVDRSNRCYRRLCRSHRWQEVTCTRQPGQIQLISQQILRRNAGYPVGTATRRRIFLRTGTLIQRAVKTSGIALQQPFGRC